MKLEEYSSEQLAEAMLNLSTIKEAGRDQGPILTEFVAQIEKAYFQAQIKEAIIADIEHTLKKDLRISCETKYAYRSWATVDIEVESLDDLQAVLDRFEDEAMPLYREVSSFFVIAPILEDTKEEKIQYKLDYHYLVKVDYGLIPEISANFYLRLQDKVVLVRVCHEGKSDLIDARRRMEVSRNRSNKEVRTPGKTTDIEIEPGCPLVFPPNQTNMTTSGNHPHELRFWG